MSGLFGFFNVDHASEYVSNAAQQMQSFEWQTCRTWNNPEDCASFGHIGIGIFNTEPQPVFSADGNLVLFLCGELYHTEGLRRELEGAANRTDAELALAAFEKWGMECPHRLEGAYFIAVYDIQQQRLTLFNDRFGLYPHYYTLQGNRFIFAPEIKAIISAPWVPRELNLTSIADYVRFQIILGTKTFHEGIHRFPYGSITVFDLSSGDLTVKRYWDWSHIPDNPQVNFDEAVEEVGRLFQEGIRYLSSGSLRPGVFLSGGLDSRTIIGLMPPRTPPPVSATFGAPNSRDVYYAEKIAAVVGSDHHWFNLDEHGRWILENVDLHFKLTEGFHSWIHMHGITMLPGVRGMMDYNLSGWDGGTVMGHSDHINPIYNNPVNFSTVLTENFHRFNQAYTWPGMTEAEERMLYAPAFSKQMQGLAFDSMRSELTRFWDFKRDYAAEYFYVTNHCWRHTGNMITFTRSHIEARFPFWTYSLIDFMYSLRPEIRRDQLMYRTIITQRTPKLAHIPYDKQEYLPTTNELEHKIQAMSVRVKRRLKMFPNRPTLYADYENYLRRELRPWAESILFGPNSNKFGLFDQNYVRELLERHVAGREEWTIGKISHLITLEMVMQRLFD
ncbi:MAG: asparagine synthetase B [Anaerolineae bacterium]|nr:asparagine synthetase B [Anaerolineae bacterium]